MHTLVRNLVMALFIAMAAPLSLSAQAFSTDFEQIAIGTKAQDIRIPGISFSSADARYLIQSDESDELFNLIRGNLLSSFDHDDHDAPADEGPLTVAFQSSVSTLSLDAYIDFGVPGETAELDIDTFSGGALLRHYTFATVKNVFLEVHATIDSQKPFDRVQIYAHYFGGRGAPYNRSISGLDNLFASRAFTVRSGVKPLCCSAIPVAVRGRG